MFRQPVPQAEAMWLLGEAPLKQARIGVRKSVLARADGGFNHCHDCRIESLSPIIHSLYESAVAIGPTADLR